MKKFYCTNGTKIIEISEAQNRTYDALYKAAERIGSNNYKAGLYGNGKFKPGKPISYRITQAHQDIIDAMPKVLSGEMSCEEAMALINSYDANKQRLGL
jgi:hypothetical protein